jgi:hypothetical protein
MGRKIKLVINIEGLNHPIISTLSEQAYSDESGVRRLLEIDPTSEVIVRKANGDTFSYSYEIN